MKGERSDFLQAEPYERTEKRKGHANGFKPKTIYTRCGELKISIPQVRGLEFYPRCVEKGLRSEKALKLAIGEMYVQGVSTRKVEKITEMLCGYNLSSTQVSRIAQEMDKELEVFRNRKLGEFPYMMLDARYEKIRHGGQIIDMAILIAIGINRNGYCEILGVSVSMSEAEIHWAEFLNSLKERGLKGVKLITSDDHKGLKNARKSVFSGVPWQRCQYHMSENAQAYSPTKNMKKEIGSSMRNIFNAPSKNEALNIAAIVGEEYKKKAPTFAKWLEENIEESLTIYNFPVEHRKRLRTSNLIERLNKEIKRRTRVAGIFPNEESCCRLVSAILIEINEEWITGKRYLNMDCELFAENITATKLIC